ncbi:M14 family metallopeptidase [Bacillus sp. FJAT-44742]|uniref:M14 family metallopeptidase n=1 Tax=Bacillus sp. FJAT-44742 TaxID=2014005 RepID=UPI000C236B05|nr:M14 family metallopeptidase [Bacillus sp. FJAT-44742]
MVFTYKTTSGDTLTKVANRFHIRIEDLLAANKEIPSSHSYLYPGRHLLIPDNASSTKRKKLYPCSEEYGWRELDNDRRLLQSQTIKGLKVEQIGQSVMKKPLWLFKYGKGQKKIFLTGTWHGNEWMNSWLLMSFLKTFIKKVNTKAPWLGYSPHKLYQDATLFIVPLVNPDGAELVQEGLSKGHSHYEQVAAINDGWSDFRHWSANINGVDLNHQWPAGWKEEAKTSPKQPWYRHFGGVSPISEPESKSIYLLTMKEDFSHVLAFHSQGQEIYWGYRDMEPKVCKNLAERLASASSYHPVKTAASAAGFKDWFIKEWKRPGFTIETGNGKNPLSFDASLEMWLNNVPLILESLTFPSFSPPLDKWEKE